MSVVDVFAVRLLVEKAQSRFLKSVLLIPHAVEFYCPISRELKPLDLIPIECSLAAAVVNPKTSIMLKTKS